jgi:hypothetical protein
VTATETLATQPIVLRCPSCWQPIVVTKVKHIPYPDGRVTRSLEPAARAIDMHLRFCLGPPAWSLSLVGGRTRS